MSTIDSRIVSFIVENFGLDVDDVEGESGLFSSGILDSFNMVDLVAFVESEAGIKFGMLDLNLENLDSVERIVSYVKTKAE